MIEIHNGLAVFQRHLFRADFNDVFAVNNSRLKGAYSILTVILKSNFKVQCAVFIGIVN